jgi:hypothetical protein
LLLFPGTVIVKDVLSGIRKRGKIDSVARFEAARTSEKIAEDI